MTALKNLSATEEVSKVAVTDCVTEPVATVLKVGSPSPKSMLSFEIGLSPKPAARSPAP